MTEHSSQQRSDQHWVTCLACGKRGYVTKQDAKRALRQLRDGMNAYRCRVGGIGWHLGHLPQSVVSGEQGRPQIKDPRTMP